MSDFLTGKSLRKLHKGVKVERASDTLPQTAQEVLFNIVGGRVLLRQIVGECEVVMGAVANNTSLISNPTVGTDAALCAVLNTANDEAGTLYGITGTVADAMLGVSAGGVAGQLRDVVLPVGSLDLLCAANNTGEIAWTLLYIPLDDGAYVVAV